MTTTIARLTACLMSLIALTLGSCSAPTVADAPTDDRSPAPTPSSPIATQPAPSPSVAARLAAPTGTPSPTTTINIYKVDTQCANLAPEKVTVTANQSLEAAIAQVLAETDSGDFSIAGYRVSREGAQAIVDLRLPANAKRSFYSLSSCEQLALFGGIRKTLLNNSQWKIQSVQFTEKGQEIVL
ncbi:MAG TPA: sporulation/spore germination protein [Candidatus Sericytochromatia bacterium]